MILGIDPGRDKIGWALTDDSGGLLFSGILQAPDLFLFLDVFARCSMGKGFYKNSKSTEDMSQNWIIERRTELSLPEKLNGDVLKYVALGDGTGFREIIDEIKDLGCEVVVVDESMTTLLARQLYWRLHVPLFWRRFLPRSLAVPPRVLDDLAAWGIILRSLGL